MCTRPPTLKNGDHIAIIAPASKIDHTYIETAEKVFDSWGLRVIIGKYLFKTNYKFAGTDHERLSDVQFMLDHPEVKAIICARGGYGFNRIMDHINYSAFKARPKWIVGFSDITAWHCQLNVLGFQSLHAIMPSYFLKDRSTVGLQSLMDALFGKPQHIVAPVHSNNRLGKVKGSIIGGNLALLCTMTGTNSDLDTKGKILFLEDVGEKLYNIDRMMVHLKRAGKLEGLAACIVGKFTECEEKPEDFGKDSMSIIREHLSSYDFPVCFDFPAGHVPDSYALPFGQTVTLEIRSDEVRLDIPGSTEVPL